MWLASTPVLTASRRYFHDEQALAFNVDASGAPGTQWPETPAWSRSVRMLDWQITKTQQTRVTNNESKRDKSAKNLIKAVLGQVPFTAELYWLVRHSNKPI